MRSSASHEKCVSIAPPSVRFIGSGSVEISLRAVAPQRATRPPREAPSSNPVPLPPTNTLAPLCAWFYGFVCTRERIEQAMWEQDPQRAVRRSGGRASCGKGDARVVECALGYKLWPGCSIVPCRAVPETVDN